MVQHCNWAMYKGTLVFCVRVILEVVGWDGIELAKLRNLMHLKVDMGTILLAV